MLVGLCGPVCMALLTSPDLADGLLHRALSTAEYALVRTAGFVTMLLYGGGWIWLGESLWRR